VPSFEGITLNSPFGPRYRVGVLRNRGGFSVVHEGTVIETGGSEQLRAGQRVAIKIFENEDLTAQQLQKIYQNESVNLRRLAEESPRNIPHLLDTFLDVSIRRSCLVMQFIDGVPLERVIPQLMKLDPHKRAQRALDIALDIATALRDCQHRGIVHRDLNSKNILIDRNPPQKTYLIDFGLSYFTRQDVSMLEELPPLATLEYTAPEILEKQSPDFTSDMFSLGCLLFEMLTGRTPFAEIWRGRFPTRSRRVRRGNK